MRSMTAVLLTLSLVSGCTLLKMRNMKKPKIEVSSVQVKQIVGTKADLLVGLTVKNENEFELKVEDLEYRLFLDQKDVGSEKLKEPVVIPALSEKEVQLPISAKLGSLLASLVRFVGDGETDYRVEGSAKVGSVTVPFDHKGSFKMKKEDNVD